MASVDAIKVPLPQIEPFRSLFLQETNFQVRYNACHERGWTDSYLLTVDDVRIGYGSVKGQETADRDTVFEFYAIPAFRSLSSPIFARLLAASRPKFLECQTNDAQMSAMLYEFSRNIGADVALFEDHTVTGLSIPGARVRPRREDDRLFEHRGEPEGDYVLEHGEIVATGGFLLHYNKPFADLYMEVRADSRRKGYGSFLLQEVKKACYLAGRVPSARCDISNRASRAALVKAGLRVCGFMLKGVVK